MMLSSLLLASPLALAGEAEVEWKAPKTYLVGGTYVVEITVQAPSDGADLPTWMLTASGFSVGEEPVAPRTDDATVHLPPGSQLTFSFDLGQYLGVSRSFQLRYATEVIDEEPIDVQVFEPASEGLSFMDMPVADLKQYEVLLQTNRGPVHLELWPDVAPNHVRNMLDLAFSGFYDGLTFHRVIAGFMIQGGDPTGTGSGSGPRNVKAEFSEREHERGVLSMARSSDPDSASAQFFICHGSANFLDGKYSAFGKVISGMDAVDAIATAPTGRNDKPVDPQVIRKATVITRAEN